MISLLACRHYYLIDFSVIGPKNEALVRQVLTRINVSLDNKWFLYLSLTVLADTVPHSFDYRGQSLFELLESVNSICRFNKWTNCYNDLLEQLLLLFSFLNLRMWHSCLSACHSYKQMKAWKESWQMIALLSIEIIYNVNSFSIVFISMLNTIYGISI